MRQVIVSRHPATVAWLQARFPKAGVLSGNANAEDVKDCHIIGNVPLALAAEARYITAVEFSGPPPRGEELTEVEENGIRLTSYTVARVDGSIPEMDSIGRCLYALNNDSKGPQCPECAFIAECW
jgi:hypothetical protein